MHEIKQNRYLEKRWKETTDNDESNASESGKELVEHFMIVERINDKIENILRNTHDEILFLISTEGIFLKIKTEIYKFIKIFSELNVDVRILIPGVRWIARNRLLNWRRILKLGSSAFTDL